MTPNPVLHALVDRIRGAGTVLELEVALQDFRDLPEFPMVVGYWREKYEEDLVDVLRKHADRKPSPNDGHMDLPKNADYTVLQTCLTGYRAKFVRHWWENQRTRGT